ncbi:MAG: hypothetical protein D6761_12465 [Candidatus Dadabacteria bacterium]|nr:MAG: hypothetical protein D6761_12465 [Candidatus Dadabacteria bacterium]
MVRCALVWLLVALLVQAVTLNVAEPPAWLARLAWFPTWLHLITIGWLTQLIFAIAWWMLPVIDRQRGRGSDALMGVVAVLLNSGLVLRIACEAPARQQASALAQGGYLGSLLVLIAATVLFAGLIWRRVR